MFRPLLYGGWPSFAAPWITTKAAAPRFVGFEAWALLLPSSGDFADSHLCSTQLVHEHQSSLVIRIAAITAPRPLLRFEHQSSLHRLAMHIAQLLRSLFLREHDQIIKAAARCAPVPPARSPRRVAAETSAWRKPASTRRANPCLMACITNDGFPRSGSVTSRCTCSGITTYPITAKR